MAQEYKALKEAFVSNLSGGSISEINSVTLVAASASWLWAVLQSRRKFFTPYSVAAQLTDFMLNCGAILLAVTLYSSTPGLLNGLLLMPAVTLYMLSHQLVRPRTKPRMADSNDNSGLVDLSDSLPLKPFVTSYRGSMMIITCIAILAVDFPVFPRRFAKVENWGTSLMDLGVGSFVFSAGFVNARPILKERLTGRSASLTRRLYTALRHSLSLLLLGAIRLYSVKGLDYAEHVTEYGVHWNFFFTLACLPPFSALFRSLFHLVPSYAVLSLLVGVAYETALDTTDLKAYVFTAPRKNLLSKNREGVFSFFGYLAIFLAGQATGMYVLPRSIANPAPTPKQHGLRRSIPFQLAIWSLIWSLLFTFSTSYRFGLNLQVSRRLANLPYYLWVCAFNCAQLTLFSCIEALCFPAIQYAKERETETRICKEATSKLLNAFNRNGLAIFLLANLLTGLVNLTIPTLQMSHLQAMAILVAYAVVLSGIALLLDRYDVSIKL